MPYAYLSFFPISKNILMLSSNYFKLKGDKNKFKFQSKKYYRSGEPRYLDNGGHDLGTGWFPWLWSRIPRSKNEGTGWQLYFNDWENVNFIGDDIVDLGLCCQSIFNLNNHMMKIIDEEKEKIEWSKYEGQEKVGIHIRRGEVYLKDNPNSNWGVCRTYYTIDEYMEALNKISQAKIIYIASDSNETIPYLKEKYPDYIFLSNTYDSNKYYVPSGNDNFSTIEGWCAKHPEQIEFFVNTALIDLYFLSQCDKFVGTIKISCYSKVAYLLNCGRQKKRIDYYDMDKTEVPLSLEPQGNDGLLLL